MITACNDYWESGGRHNVTGRLVVCTRSRAPEVVDLIFSNPVLYARFVAGRLNITQQGAINLLRQLSEIGALREDGRGRGVLARWYADEVFELLL
ncbi:MAG: helix-turn-helix domain-containing protein [Mycobacteriales bacterium]